MAMETEVKNNLELSEEVKHELDKINKDIRERSEQEEQYRHRLVRERNKAAYQKRMMSPEYKARTRRLIEKGGTVEHFYPVTKDLTTEEFYELVEDLQKDLSIQAKLNQGMKKIISRREAMGDGTVPLQSETC